jgi:murein DD-endopeptidase MepM/ murein hydrolase activator NlpD
MSWNDIMRRVLPPIKTKKPDGTYRILEPNITSHYGETYNRPKDSSNPHGGVDFNYFGGQTSPFNLSHQGLRSPVTGIVTNAGEGSVGRIAIRDANGFTHEILHTHAQHVSIGDPVVAGQLIGTMGNTGAKQQHVHYQLKDRDGNVINPSAYWDQQGPIDPNPAPPAHLDDYERYLGTPSAAMGNDALNAGVGDERSLRRFQSQPTKAAVPYLDQTNAARQHFANVPAPVPAVPSPANPNDADGPADPWTDANLPRSFNGRFGPGSSGPLQPARPLLRDPKNGQRSEAPDMPPSTSVAFDIPGSHFGRLLTNTAHFVPDDMPPSTQAMPSDQTGPERQGSFNNQSNSASSQAPAPKLDPGFRELSSPTLPRGWSRMTPEELIQDLPAPEPLSDDARQEWFANWIRSFR